ncbi:MAG: hypothetical protein RMZ43_019535 [Nostoc sp. CmiVER01]|uniref:hypothetical protein n=1 Tax=Nostoc sp. CmiVER01 TaxID=3075384 RepID=UPI003D1619C7
MEIQSTLTQAIEVIVMSFVALMIFDFIDRLYVVPLPSIAIAQFNVSSKSTITATQFEPLSNTEQVKVEPQQIPFITSQFEEISEQFEEISDQAPLGRGIGYRVLGVGGYSAPTTSGIQAPSSQDDCIGGGSSPDLCRIPYTLHPTPYTLLPDPWTLELEPHNSSTEIQPVILQFSSLKLLPPATGVQPKAKATRKSTAKPKSTTTKKSSKFTNKAATPRSDSGKKSVA